jgi:L-threonylcarbamoyladenylate synthase
VNAASANGRLAAVIAAGGLALIPTDTVYGLCCDAENAVAAARLLALKGRSANKPSAVAFASVAAVLAALPELGPRTAAALETLLPGPLTLLVANPARRFPLAGGTLLGVRVFEPRAEAGRAILLTSANHAGGRDAATLAEVPAPIRAGVDCAIEGGTLAGTPSTVVDLGAFETSGAWALMREGPVRAAVLERALGRLVSE